MARPKKEGMDYFPHDSDSVNDEKIEALRSLYGNDGYAFYFIMLERIYRTNNFELDVSDAETREETFQILSRKMMLNVEEFKKILNTAMKWGCFDKELYENEKLITSRGIKKRSEVVTDKRKSMQAYYKTSKKVSDAETIPETIPETTQSKEEKRREEKSKEKKSKKDNKNTYSDSVKLTDEQYEKLIKEFGEADTKDKIESLSLYVNSTGKKYKCHYSTILNWARKDNKTKIPNTEKKEEPKQKHANGLYTISSYGSMDF